MKLIWVERCVIIQKKKREERKDKGLQVTGMEHKQPVVGLLERNGRIKLQVIDKANSVNIKPIIAETVSANAEVVTDGFGAYRGLNKLHQEHHILNKEKEEYVKGQYHTNTLEGFWTLLKRGIYGQYHKVTTKHLQAYLDEFTFKYNHRANKSNFALLIQRSLTYV